MISDIPFFLFITTLCLILATYLFYPLSVYIISLFVKYEIKCQENYYPFISIIISAFNEERDIGQKLKNVLSIDYPESKFEIIVGSDGSTDKTVEIAKKHKMDNIKVLEFLTNRGKTAVQNDCVKAASGDILVFTDAASFFEKDTIKHLIANFTDETVGGVAGKLLFVDTNRNINTQSQGVYWKYELMIRHIESKIGKLIGVDGPLYAIRKENFIYLDSHVISDFILPLLVIEQGKKVILDERAVILEEPTLKSEQEFTTRRRITLRAFQGLKAHKELLNPFNHFWLTTQIIFHKLIRWLVGVLAIVNFISILFLVDSHPTIYNFFLTLYVMLIIIAGIGYILNKLNRKFKLFSIPYYFFLVNAAATLGFFDFIRNKQAIAWKPVRK